MKTARSVRSAVRFTVLAIAAAAAVVGTAVDASAHVDLSSVTPANGSSVDIAPSEVVLVFAATPLGVASVTVTGPGGTTVSTGAPTQNGPRVFQALGPLTTQGLYTTSYSVVASDSDKITGTTAFTYTGQPAAGPAATTTTTAAAGGPANLASNVSNVSNVSSATDATDDSDGRDTGDIVIGAVIVLALLAGVYFLYRRLRRRS